MPLPSSANNNSKKMTVTGFSLIKKLFNLKNLKVHLTELSFKAAKKESPPSKVRLLTVCGFPLSP